MAVLKDGRLIGRPTKAQKRQQAEEVAARGEINRFLKPAGEFAPRGRAKPTEDRKRAFLGSVAVGLTVAESMRQNSVPERTYMEWRKDKEFVEVLDLYRMPKATWSGGFADFRKKYFGFDSYWHHKKIIDAIENAEPMSNTLILCAPEHGKSTVLVDYICYRLALDPNLRITVVSETQDLARKMIQQVQRRMTDPAVAAAYIADFGPFYEKGQSRTGKPWTADYFTVVKASHDQKDPSLECRGASSHIYGTRIDLLLFDDIQSTEGLAATDKLLRKIRQDFLSRPGTDGRTAFVGTRIDVGDIYERLQDEGIVDNVVQLPAATPELEECPRDKDCTFHESCCGLHGANGDPVPHQKPIAPEMWPAHELAKKRRDVSEPVWFRCYQQEPQAAGDSCFTDEMIEDAKDRQRLVGPKPGLVVMGLDPAMGGQLALTIASLSAEKMEILDLETQMGVGRFEQIYLRLEESARVYRPSVVVIETDTHQKGLARDDRLREIASKLGFMVVEHRTSGQKADSVIGVRMMAGSFSRGEIRIPWGDTFAQRKVQTLCDELRGWRPELNARSKQKQDTVASTWFVWKYWTEIRHSLLGHVENQFQRAGVADAFKRVGSTAMALQRRSA